MADSYYQQLRPQQRMFVDEYLIDLNGKQAAIRAGYSPRSAQSQASRLLSTVKVQKAVQERMESRALRCQITQDMVLQELAKLGFSNQLDYIRISKFGDPVHDFSNLTRDQAAAIQELTVETYQEGPKDDPETVKRVKLKLGDKRQALELIGKHLGMWTKQPEEPDEIPEETPTDLSAWSDEDVAHAADLWRKLRGQTRGGGDRTFH